MDSNKRDRLSLILTGMQRDHAEGPSAGDAILVRWVRARVADDTLTDNHVADLLDAFDRGRR